MRRYGRIELKSEIEIVEGMEDEIVERIKMHPLWDRKEIGIDDQGRKLCFVEGCNNLGWNKGKRGTRTVQRGRWCDKHRKSNHSKVFEKKKCERCGFIAIHKAQMDIDHIDGNSGNNEISNLQVLCANCHRLKTMENGDHLWNPADHKKDCWDCGKLVEQSGRGRPRNLCSDCHNYGDE